MALPDGKRSGKTQIPGVKYCGIRAADAARMPLKIRVLSLLTQLHPMKHLPVLLLAASLALAALQTQAQVGIGTDTPAASALLEVTSDSKGVLIPRMTSTERTGISNPAEGLLVYQTNSPSGFYYRSGSTWVRLVNSNETVASSSPSFYTADRSGSTAFVTIEGTPISLAGDRITSGNLVVVHPENTHFIVSTSGRFQVSYKIALQTASLLGSLVKINEIAHTPSSIQATSTRSEYATSFIVDLVAGDIISLCLAGPLGFVNLNGGESTYLSLVKLE